MTRLKGAAAEIAVSRLNGTYNDGVRHILFVEACGLRRDEGRVGWLLGQFTEWFSCRVLEKHSIVRVIALEALPHSRR